MSMLLVFGVYLLVCTACGPRWSDSN